MTRETVAMRQVRELHEGLWIQERAVIIAPDLGGTAVAVSVSAKWSMGRQQFVLHYPQPGEALPPLDIDPKKGVGIIGIAEQGDPEWPYIYGLVGQKHDAKLVYPGILLHTGTLRFLSKSLGLRHTWGM